jgi:colanic acid biosynthesis glycosyl transferase WcaI
MCDVRRPRIVFLNQSIGQTFRQLAVDLTDQIGPGVLYVGSEGGRQIGNLRIRHAPCYRSERIWSRLWTWGLYLLWTALSCLLTPGEPLLFVVSNPPFTPLVAWLLKHLRGWRYVSLVWDVYPDSLVRFGYLAEHGWATRLWRALNRIALQNADAVITIGPHMAQTLRQGLGNADVQIQVIPNWADTQAIRPLSKAENPFALQYGQVDKLTVLYSGKMGLTHDLDTLLQVARRWQDRADVGFLLIGGGAKYQDLEQAIVKDNLTNVTLLPWQPESALPYSLPTGDVAVVSLDRGAEGVSMPSRTYFMMAAGCAIVGINHGQNDLRDTLETYACGVSVEPGDVDGLTAALQRFYESPTFLAGCRQNARLAAENTFSHQAIVEQYLELLKPLLAH